MNITKSNALLPKSNRALLFGNRVSEINGETAINAVIDTVNKFDFLGFLYANCMVDQMKCCIHATIAQIITNIKRI